MSGNKLHIDSTPVLNNNFWLEDIAAMDTIPPTGTSAEDDGGWYACTRRMAVTQTVRVNCLQVPIVRKLL